MRGKFGVGEWGLRVFNEKGASMQENRCTFAAENIIYCSYMTIAVDFDGTIVRHRYPDIGEEIPFATQTLKMLIEERHKLILWSVREGKLLDDAVEWCRERGVEFYAVNRDFPEEDITKNQHFSRKLKVDVWIDDRNVGGLPDWGTIYDMIHNNKTYEEVMTEQLNPLAVEQRPRKKWWQF